MIKLTTANGVITSLINEDVSGENLINPWGVETADSSAFFSLDRSVGYRYTLNHQTINETKNRLEQSLDVKMREGSWGLHCLDQLTDESTITREAELICHSDSIFMDFVMRFRFKKEHFDHALINNQKIYHTNSNTYFQFPVKTASLVGKKQSVTINIKEAVTTDKLTPLLYVRDRGDEWIIHARMLPVVIEKDVIKLCNSLYQTRPLPEFITKLILSSSAIKKALWYRNEHSPYKSKIARLINPNAFPMAKLSAGEKLKWSVTCHLH